MHHHDHHGHAPGSRAIYSDRMKTKASHLQFYHAADQHLMLGRALCQWAIYFGFTKDSSVVEHGDRSRIMIKFKICYVHQ